MTETITEERMFDIAQIPHALSLADRFTLPPFTVLNGRDGWWQSRKRQWMDLGIRSADGRDAKTFAKGSEGREATLDEVSKKILAVSDGQSVFDPVLTEMAYRWFVPIGGSILDPFAGGSVRGIVAGVLGRPYVGIDLSADQCAANEAQSQDFHIKKLYPQPDDDVRPTWTVGDAAKVLSVDATDRARYDFVWSCPPYHDLEVYSDDPHDLSVMKWEPFLDAYRYIIQRAVHHLADDRFAAFVVGEIRDPRGMYRNFVGETVRAFEDAGARYYNEVCWINPAGTLPLRAAKQFVVSRKMGRTHQTVLVFVKGDPKAAAMAQDPDAMVDLLGKPDPDIDDF